MKKLILYIAFIILHSQAWAQTAPIPDPVFLNFLKTWFPQTINNNNQLIISEAEAVTWSVNCINQGIQSLEGIQYFKNIPALYASRNQLSEVPDLSALSEIKILHLQKNRLTELPSLSGMTQLEELMAFENQINHIPDLSNNTALKQILLYTNRIISLPNINHLQNLELLEVGENQLTSLPSLSGMTNLKGLFAWRNKLTTLPDFSTLTNLTDLNVGDNLLTASPDLSNNPQLKVLIINQNLLTRLPKVVSLQNLTVFDIQNNKLSFADLLPVNSYPDYSTKFTIAPQANITMLSIEKEETTSLQIALPVDQEIEGINYQWYKNNQLIASTAKLYIDKLTLSDAGKYHCITTHPDLPELTLYSDTFRVTITPCIDISALNIKIIEGNCQQKSQLTIEGIKSNSALKYLLSDDNNRSIESNNGEFKQLIAPVYRLQISNALCTKDYENPIEVRYTACEEAFLTPNGDGIDDNYYFQETGIAHIYNSEGILYKTLTIPTEWDGTNLNGIVVPGYYIVDINNGATIMSITVLY